MNCRHRQRIHWIALTMLAWSWCGNCMGQLNLLPSSGAPNPSSQLPATSNAGLVSRPTTTANPTMANPPAPPQQVQPTPSNSMRAGGGVSEPRGAARALLANRPSQPSTNNNQQDSAVPPTTPPQSLNGQPLGNPQAVLSQPTQQALPNLTIDPPVARAATTPDALAITPEAIQAQLQQLQTVTDIDATTKQLLTTAYEAIAAEVKKRIEEERMLKEIAVAIEAAPNATLEAKKRKESPTAAAPYKDGSLPWSHIESLQSWQLETQALAQAATKARSDTETAITTREARRKEIPRLLKEDSVQATKLNEDLAAPPVEGLDPRVREANLLLIRARLAAVNARVRRIEQEQRYFDAETELLPIRKEVYIAEEKFYLSKLKELSEELGKRRENFVAKQKMIADELLHKVRPELRAQAQRIVTRTDEWFRLVKDYSVLPVTIDENTALQKQWADRFKTMTNRLSREPGSDKNGDRAVVISKFKSLVGQMLRRQRNDLPDIDRLNQHLEDYQSKIQTAESTMLSLDDWKAENSSQSNPTNPAPDFEATVKNFANLSVADQRFLLESLERKVVDEYRLDANKSSESYFKLVEINQQMIDQVRKYRDFIDEHILWIRSSDPFNKADARLLWPSILWLFDLKNWMAVSHQLIEDFKNHLWEYMLAAACLGALVVNTKTIRKHAHQMGLVAAKPNCTSFIPTARVLVCCVLLSLPLPLIHLLLGWRLLYPSEPNAFVEAIGVGLMVGARYFFPLELIRQICRVGGLAENHFQWPVSSTQQLRTRLRWFIDLGIPTSIVVGIVSQFTESRWENSLGRVAFCVLMALCSLFMLLVLNPRRGVFGEFLRKHPGGWIDRLRFLWYPGLSLAPVALIAMTLMGYHYTAIRLAIHLHTSCLTLVGILLLDSLICRWLLLRRRQLVISQARQRLEEARRRDPSTQSNAVPEAPAAVNTATDIAQINAQTIRLVKSTLIFAACAAIAFIWSSVLPAVGVLDSVQLWTVIGETPDDRLPVTLANLLLAIPAAIMTIVAAKNLPGLLEIALLQHLPLENAVRYAITSLSRYTILILGIAMTFNSMGVRWASVQWLVAALGVGLGFGLQEIFANFVSGLILLFEQPIRVGDVITVGDTTGTVSRIRMRATTVTNFDQQELVIPNKDLITGRLLNWTLSDSTNRMIIEIGVAYGTDTDKACSMLREICSNHPNVLKSPEPTAFFELFGDSTLQLKVRLFLASLDLRLPTRHDLLTRIHQRFSDAGIEISFPQRELHIRSLPKELMLFGRDRPTGDNPPQGLKSAG